MRREDHNLRQFDDQRQRNDRNREQNYERRREALATPPPPLHSIHRGEVMNIQAFGVFVKIESGHQGLVHISQICQRRISADDLKDMLAIREQVWVKVIRNESDDYDKAKISLSMKYVDQISGVDLDPTNAQLQLQEDRARRPYLGSGPSEGFELQAVLNTRCTRCGMEGHFAQDCYNQIGKATGRYDLIQADELPDHDRVQEPKPTWQEKPLDLKKKDKDKKSKKDKDKKAKKDKHKKHKKHKKDKHK